MPGHNEAKILPSGTALTSNAALVREQLRRLVSHPLFTNSKRYPVLLTYTVEQTLLGNAGDLKERTIGVEAFGREPSYDVNLDPVVRTTAAEVRKRLIQYYYSPDHAEQLVIELPLGSYVPSFREPPHYSSASADKAANTREVELEVIRKVDATALRSAYEKDLLEKIVPDARLLNFPISREIPGPSSIAWKDRRDVVFIGGFAHPPNADAVKYFVSEVWPLLRDTGFSEHFIIAGSYVPDEIAALASDNIIVRGFVEDLSDIFGKCRLSVAPLRYGAGVKGKVVTSLSYGVPCVATKIAAEGSGLVHNENILVADDAGKMAGMIRTLCTDQRLWEKLSQSGLSYCEEKFSIRATREIIDKAFAELLIQKNDAGYCRQ